MYVGTKMTLNNVTPDCITVLLSPKNWKTKKGVKINLKEIEWVKYFIDTSSYLRWQTTQEDFK